MPASLTHPAGPTTPPNRAALPSPLSSPPSHHYDTPTPPSPPHLSPLPPLYSLSPPRSRDLDRGRSSRSRLLERLAEGERFFGEADLRATDGSGPFGISLAAERRFKGDHYSGCIGTASALMTIDTAAASHCSITQFTITCRGPPQNRLQTPCVFDGCAEIQPRDGPAKEVVHGRLILREGVKACR
jgi:hypothetical protein